MVRRNQRLLGIVTSLALLSGCSRGMRRLDQNECPTGITAQPSSHSGIVWGGDKAKIQAEIISVAVECYPVRHRSIEREKARREAFTDYKIAATANVTYKIKDEQFLARVTKDGNIEATVIFEALSASGVELRWAMGTFRVVKRGSTGTVSATIAGLSEEEIVTVTSVQARWRYEQ